VNAHSARRSTRWLPDPATVDEYRTFFATAARNPAMLGAATPTSSAVAATVAQVVPTTGTPVVVELGPGTGSLSCGIQERLPQGARHVGIELNEDLVAHLRTHKPWLEVVHGNAEELHKVLADLQIDRVDAVVSSIPWSLLPDDTQDHILGQVADALVPHGAFTALTYLTALYREGGKKFRRRLGATFDEVLTHTTWLNFPPALHYLCRRPLSVDKRVITSA
jgi:phospholipid N-methyltransferase